MWIYVKRYLHWAIIAALFMVGEVAMDLLQPGIMSRIVDEGVLGLENGGVGSMRLIWTLGLLMIGLVLFGTLCGCLNNGFTHMAAQNIGNDIRKDAFRILMRFSFSQMDAYGTGTLVTRMTNDITQIQTFVGLFMRSMIRTSLLMFGSIACMFRLNRDFGWVVLAAFPFLVGCLLFCMVRSGPLFTRLQSQLDTINGILQEDINGIRMIKACVRECYEKARFGKANGALIRTQLQVLVLFACMNPVTSALMYLVVAAILMLGSVEVGSGAASPGSIMAAITYTTQLLNGILMLVTLFQNISRGLASWQRVRAILQSAPAQADGDADGDAALHGAIEWRNVCFTYPGSETPVLDGVSLAVQPRETLAIMGSTGCGKTSLINLVPRFYDVSDGAVLVDGVDVRDYRQQALRDKIAIAPQRCDLFSTSIGENIAWGDPAADAAAIRRAAVIAQADAFISDTEHAYDTLVSERGTSLSGGQKQRLSMARAVLKDAEILIIDDATSALDLQTEADLYAALRHERPHCTILLVAQRIATARHADRIAVLENGRLVGCDTHDALLANCPTYQAIVQSQFGEEGDHA